ncbi:MAG: NAD(P)H-hydrate epimerase [Eubacteriales bacterium]|nr:NAD(P)H-hydrate epimerase [Eubacteriales bacterium]
MEYLLTGAEMAECDRRTSEVIGIPSLVLMERAALSVADGVEARLLHSGCRSDVLAFAGRGNNGADALAAGRILLERGFSVHFLRLPGNVSADSSFAVQEKILSNYGKKVEIFSAEKAGSAEKMPEAGMQAPSVLIDGLFGTGLSRNLEGDAALAVRYINDLRNRFGTYVVAVDIPSGISSDTGQVMGAAVRCDETRTFAFFKRGHWMYPGTVYAGRIHLAQIGITPLTRRPGMFTYREEGPALLLPARDPGGNKGTFGKVLVIAGRRNMCGAALLAAQACMVTGAGMVKLFTHDANREIVQQALPEAMLETWTEDDSPGELQEKLESCLRWADAAAAGPAMGTDESAKILLRALLACAAGPAEEEPCAAREESRVKTEASPAARFLPRGLVLDADALRILAGSPELRGMLAARRPDLPCVLTPHLAEFAALAQTTVRDCADNRAAVVQEQADLLRCVIACKDARTLVVRPCPSPGDQFLYLNTSGNSGMASAGSGDVLTGMTAAVLAQGGSDGFDAACAAVHLHGLAGDRARERHGEQGMTARDLIEALREHAFWKS